MDVFDSAENLPKEVEVLLSINDLVLLIQVRLEATPGAVLHLDHQVDRGEFDVLLRKLVERIIVAQS